MSKVNILLKNIWSKGSTVVIGVAVVVVVVVLREVREALSLPHHLPPVAVTPQFEQQQTIQSEAPQYLLDPQKL